MIQRAIRHTLRYIGMSIADSNDGATGAAEMVCTAFDELQILIESLDRPPED